MDNKKEKYYQPKQNHFQNVRKFGVANFYSKILSVLLVSFSTFVFLKQIHIGFFTFEFTQRIIGCGRLCFVLL